MRIFIFVVTAVLALGACKDEHDHQGEAHAEVCEASLTHAEYGDAEIVDQPGAKIGDLTRCPISGSVFPVTDASPAIEQKGETYYTCCGGCTAELEKSFARRR